jgi:hypothetical protein
MLRRPSDIGFADCNEIAEKCLADLQAVVHAIKVGPRPLDALHLVTSVTLVEQVSGLVAAGPHRYDKLNQL